MNTSWQKTKVSNRGLIDASINVDRNIVDEVTDFMQAAISGQNRHRAYIANQT